MSETQQVVELNNYVLTKIRPSTVAGCGVFALRELKKGQKLYADMAPKMYNLPYDEFHRLLPEVRELILERFPQIVNGSAFFFPDTRIQAFMNHSDTPNYDAENDVVLEDIEEGDEIFEDYRHIPNAEKVFNWLKYK